MEFCKEFVKAFKLFLQTGVKSFPHTYIGIMRSWGPFTPRTWKRKRDNLTI